MFSSNTKNDAIIASIQKMQPTKNEIVFLMFGEKSKTDYPLLIEQINELGITFFGGIFPGVINGQEHYESGYVLKKFSSKHQPILLKGLDSGEITSADLEQLKAVDLENSTLVTFVDGLSVYIPKCLSYMYNHFGSDANFIGGGAGSISLQQQPCVFTNEGIFQDAAVLAVLDHKVSLNVKHGWKKLVGPIVATRTDKNIIYELNWENAFDVYKKSISEDSSIEISQDNFFSIAKGYPFGIFKEGGEDIVRDPLSVGDNGEIICIADVPENTVLYILKGSANLLIQAAQEATDQCIDSANKNFSDTFVVNCISRSLYLDKDFPQELEAINSRLKATPNNTNPFGILSLGEISSSGEGYLEFYNKTLVLGIFH